MHRKRLKMVPLAAAVLLTMAGTASALEFHGYFRSGLGKSSKEGGLECFRLPGASGNQNFRLGNECETYGEAQFDQGVYEGKDGVKFDYHVMFGYATVQNGDFENLASPENHIALRQNYVDAKNLKSLNGGSVWVGKRYYQRHDIHINDFFYWNNSGPGGGVEKFGLGGTLNTSLAILRNNGNNTTNNPANNASSTLDWRLGGIPGGLEVGVQYNKEDTTLANAKNGWALFAEWQMNVLGGVNKLFGMYGKDSAAAAGFRGPNNTLGCDFGQTVGTCDQGWGILDHLVIQPMPDFSAAFAIGHYDLKNNFKWDFAGVRPVFSLSEYFKIQGELGWNKVKAASQSDSAQLTKLTIAPTIVAGKGFWARPELRAYYSYNKWNNKARDGVFGAGNGTIAGGVAGPFGTNTKGSVYGLQAEAWW